MHDEQGITCSVGVAPTKFVAKLASTQCKPDGLLVVPADRVDLLPAPDAGRRPVGGGGAHRGDSCTASACALWPTSPTRPAATLIRALGQASGAHLAELAWGRDDRVVSTHERERSVGAEETFARDVDDPELILAELLRLSEKVGARMRRAGFSGQHGRRIKVRFADFTTITRSHKRKVPTDSVATSSTRRGHCSRRCTWTVPGSGWSASASKGSSTPTRWSPNWSSARRTGAGGRRRRLWTDWLRSSARAASDPHGSCPSWPGGRVPQSPMAAPRVAGFGALGTSRTTGRG